MRAVGAIHPRHRFNKFCFAHFAHAARRYPMRRPIANKTFGMFRHESRPLFYIA